MKIAGLIPAIFLNIFYPNNKKTFRLGLHSYTWNCEVFYCIKVKGGTIGMDKECI